jgi:hypothetical protein
MVARLLPLLLAAAATTALAQAPLEREPVGPGRKNQKVEHIRHEDAGNVIEEVRVGGQAQSVTVQPKGSGMPAYEMQPSDLARTRPADRREGSVGGTQRVWNFLNF